jgi:GNAT superfamily N-acetyltransferase
MAIAWSRGAFEVSDDPRRLDLRAVHGFISRESYWAEGISEALMARAIAHSLCFGLYEGPRQVGFARVVTDRATFGYLCDVFVERERRGTGLGKWLVACGFRSMPEATRYLEIHRPDVYRPTPEVA